MRHFLFTYAIFGGIIFFSVASFFGVAIDSGGVEDSNAYLLVSVGVFLYIIIYYLLYLINNHNRYRVSNWISLLVLCVVVIIALCEGYMNSRIFHLFGVFCIPASFVGLYYAQTRSINKLLKYLDIVMLAITFGSMFAMLGFVQAIMLGDDNYSQSLSYNIAMAISINLFLLRYGNNIERFSFCKHPYYNVLSVVLFIPQLLILFLSGGKGGFVALFCSFIFLMAIERNFSKLIKYCFYIITCIIFLILSVEFLPNEANEVLEQGTNRIFSYISQDGIDMTQTSGRDELYSFSINLAKRNLFGYGLFSYTSIMSQWSPVQGSIYPHNVFIEFLLQGGVVYCVLFTLFLLFLAIKMFRICNIDKSHLLLMPLVINTFSMLQFSATYLQTSLFWFILMYVSNFQCPVANNTRKPKGFI